MPIVKSEAQLVGRCHFPTNWYTRQTNEEAVLDTGYLDQPRLTTVTSKQNLQAELHNWDHSIHKNLGRKNKLLF